MKTIRIPYNGRDCLVNYRVEVIDLGVESLPSVNAYTAEPMDDELRSVVGESFVILHHSLNLSTPAFSLTGSDNVSEKNLKKEIAQQIINNPSA